MPTYISMLRGVNLGPHNRMKMEDLRKSLEPLKFENLNTYIQSGNLVFKASKQSPLQLSELIEQRIAGVFGLSVPAITKTTEQLKEIIDNNPFLKQKNIDPSRLHVTFLSPAPKDELVKKLPAIKGDDEFRHVKEALYLHCPNGYGETKLTNGYFEKALAVRTTTRNWKTVNTLYEMAQACG